MHYDIIKLYFFINMTYIIVKLYTFIRARTNVYFNTVYTFVEIKLKFKMLKFLIVPGIIVVIYALISYHNHVPTFHHQGFLTDLDSFCTIYAIILSLVQLDYNQKMKGILDLQKKRNCSFSFY